MFARALARLARHYDRDDLAQRARAALIAYGTLIEQAPQAFATSLDVLDFLESIPFELALVGRRGTPYREALERAVAERYLPNRVCAHLDPDRPEATDLPLLRGKTLGPGTCSALRLPELRIRGPGDIRCHRILWHRCRGVCKGC